MSATRMIRPLLLAAGLFLAAGCDTLNEATQTWNKASLCIDALQAAEFTPDLNDPAKTAEQAAASSKELADLAAKAQDVTIRDALNELSAKVAELNTANLTVDNMQAFIDQKVDLYATLSTACQ
jgi:hypothetical protein